MRLLVSCLLMSLSWAAGAQGKPAVDTLLQSNLEAIDSHEVLISRVSVPANSSIPYHFHPSEEFLHILSGTVVMKRKGNDDEILKAGDTRKIPARTLHSAAAIGEAAEIIVFRVHPKGQPVVMKPEE